MENQFPMNVNASDLKPPKSYRSYDYGYGYGYSDDAFGQNPILNYWYVLLKRKWLILSVFFVILLAVTVFVFVKTPTYLATTILQISQDNTSAVIASHDRDPFKANLGDDSQARFYETQYKILTSRSLAERIVRSLNLKEDPAFKDLAKALKEQNKSPEDVTRILAYQLLGNNKLKINPLKRSNLVEISYESPYPDLAQKVANAFYAEYADFGMDTRQQSYSLIKQWLEGQLTQLAHKVETSENKIYEYGKSKKFLPIEGENNVVIKKFVELSNLLTTAQAEKAKKEAECRQIESRDGETSLILNNPLLQSLRHEVITQRAKVSSLSQIYDVNYPELKAQRAQLSELQSRLNNEVNRIRDSAKADYQAALKSENLIRTQLEAQKQEVEKFQENLVQHRILKRDMETNEQLYNALLSRVKEASVASTMVASNVAVITPADLPTVPYRPKKSLNLLIAGVVGLVAGVGLAFFMEYMDRSIKSTEELEKVCGIPSLGIVPQLSLNDEDGKGILPFIKIPLLSGKKEKSESDMEIQVLTFEKPKSAISEAVYHIRTSIELSAVQGAARVILVTSPNPDDGKTTISINLASALAASGRKVVILDADLRKPSTHAFFQQAQTPGLADFLSSSAAREEIIQKTHIPNLYLIPAGYVPPNPVVLLNSQDFEELLNSLRNEFQHVIIDSPPIIPFTDGRIISSMTDGTLLVIRHHSTTREAGRLAVQLLSQLNCKILGGILNNAHKDKLGYQGYGDYYKNYNKIHKEYS